MPAIIKPNVLLIMTDQQRFDTIAALGNEHIYTPNMDRLVRRGVTFTKAYSACPVCVAARYTVRTGCEPPTSTYYGNLLADPVPEQPVDIEQRCGPYLARTMQNLGYRTFGIGKFHSMPMFEDLGYETHIHSEELYGSQDQRARDGFASFIAHEHPEYNWIEQLMGERTDMYYMPQASALPAEITVEAWAADCAVEHIKKDDDRPYFGFVSFIGPHPPFAPPLPFNRMYDPDRMPNPIRGDIELDHMDEQIPNMNYMIWAEDINDSHARVLKSRYYGEITYIDQQLGRILDTVEARPDADNTVICFFADHGDHLGDHNAWQKESFFEQACHVPFLVSWPKTLPANTKCDELVSLADLFGIATSAAGAPEMRDGADVLGMLQGNVEPREYVYGYYWTPGTQHFKVMVRDPEWKYIFMANGGREQLFNLSEDPNELHQRINDAPDVAARLLEQAIKQLASNPNSARTLENGYLKEFPFMERPLVRIYQMDGSRGVQGFPERPEDLL
ncbi:MAG: sulfatase-like hydrolase/transferase [Armatimonadota bacterium]|nr:sulfatase-like hydrolase/transferase [bacterium]